MPVVEHICAVLAIVQSLVSILTNFFEGRMRKMAKKSSIFRLPNYDKFELPDSIDREIYSLVKILNQTGCIRTTASCAGYTAMGDGTYKSHDAHLPWITFVPHGNSLECSKKCAQLLEYVSKRLANAYSWRLFPSERREPTSLSPEAKTSLEFYQQAGAEHLFWLRSPTFNIGWIRMILPIKKEGEVESLRQYGIEKPFGVVRTKEDIRKIYQLIEMAAREFECADTIEVPALPTLEEQYDSTKRFLLSLPYSSEDKLRRYLARRHYLLARKRWNFMDETPLKLVDFWAAGAIYVVYPNVAGNIGYDKSREHHARNFEIYTQGTALLNHIAIRLQNNYAPQMSCFAGNIVNRREIPEVDNPQQFYEKADALSLFDSPLPLAFTFEGFEFTVGERFFGRLPPRIPIKVLEPQDVIKVWQLFEIAVRDFIEQIEK